MFSSILIAFFKFWITLQHASLTCKGCRAGGARERLSGWLNQLSIIIIIIIKISKHFYCSTEHTPRHYNLDHIKLLLLERLELTVTVSLYLRARHRGMGLHRWCTSNKHAQRHLRSVHCSFMGRTNKIFCEKARSQLENTKVMLVMCRNQYLFTVLYSVWAKPIAKPFRGICTYS